MRKWPVLIFEARTKAASVGGSAHAAEQTPPKLIHPINITPKRKDLVPKGKVERKEPRRPRSKAHRHRTLSVQKWFVLQTSRTRRGCRRKCAPAESMCTHGPVREAHRVCARGRGRPALWRIWKEWSAGAGPNKAPYRRKVVRCDPEVARSYSLRSQRARRSIAQPWAIQKKQQRKAMFPSESTAADAQRPEVVEISLGNISRK